MASLRRNLGVLGAIAISLAVMGPSMGVSLYPQAIAEQVGPAVPTTFLIAAVPLSIITASFVVLTRRRGSAGSLFGLVGAEIGPRTGTSAGLWLLTCYVCASAITALSFGIFMTTFLQEVGWSTSAALVPVALALLILPVTTFLAGRTMRTLGHVLLVLEGLTMVAILVVVGITWFELANGGGPQGQAVDMSDFTLEGVSAGAVALALTFALLSSAGFEGSAAAGEETDQPRRTIPVALVITTTVTSVFFIVVTMVAVWAFGTTPTELDAFTSSGSLPADMANVYVSDLMGDLITLGGAVSSFACMIGAQVAGGRVLFAFGRDGVLPRRYSRLSLHGTPVRASATIGVLAWLFTVFACLVTGFDAFDAFELTSDTAGLLFAGAYSTACAAAAVVLWRGGRGRGWAAVPAFGIVILIAMIGMQLFPLPSGWELIAPVVALAALLAGGVVGRTRGHHANSVLSESGG